jgi:hypothetical protein
MGVVVSFMHYLRDMHEINTCRADHVCLSVHLHDSIKNNAAGDTCVIYFLFHIGAFGIENM